MRLALLSDLHANRQALDACLAHAEAAGAGRYAFLGDLVDYRVSVGGVEVRVQKSVNQPQRQVGEHVRLRVNRFRGYTSEPET